MTTAAKRKRTADPVTSNAQAIESLGLQFQFLTIAPSQVEIDNINPRPPLTVDDVADLTQSIQRHGIIEPLIVRQRSNSDAVFGLIAGSRRLTAARLVDLPQIPVYCVGLIDDATARELAIVENQQRTDLPPLAEAASMDQMREGGKAVEEIAAQLGKHPGFVAKRLSLLRLIPPFQQRLQAGDLLLSTAIELARMPATVQSDIYTDTYRPGAAGEDRSEADLTPADVRQWHGRMFVQLDDRASWTMEDADFPHAPACEACPKRTGGSPFLFDDLATHPYTCTDIDCFMLKTTHMVRRARQQYPDAPVVSLSFYTDPQIKNLFLTELDVAIQDIGYEPKLGTETSKGAERMIVGWDANRHHKVGTVIYVKPTRVTPEEPAAETPKAEKPSGPSPQKRRQMRVALLDAVLAKVTTLRPKALEVIAAQMFESFALYGDKRTAYLKTMTGKAPEQAIAAFRGLDPARLSQAIVRMAAQLDLRPSVADPASLVRLADAYGIDAPKFERTWFANQAAPKSAKRVVTTKAPMRAARKATKKR